MKNINVFVYGTLLSEACNPASRLVDAEVVAKGFVPGVIYDLGWYPGFKEKSALDADVSEVVGELIRVDQEGLERLDAYEGAPSLYYRTDVTVRTDIGEFVPAQVYVYNGQVNDGDIIPGGDFLKYEQENG